MRYALALIYACAPYVKEEPLTAEQIFQKMCRYCAYQERSRHSVKLRLARYTLSEAQRRQVMSRLLQEGYVDDLRFARTFVRGRFALKKWGRIKLTQRLYLHEVSGDIVRQALQQIDEEAYRKALQHVIARKGAEMADAPQDRHRLIRYALQKGYEPTLVKEEVEDFFNARTA